MLEITIGLLVIVLADWHGLRHGVVTGARRRGGSRLIRLLAVAFGIAIAAHGYGLSRVSASYLYFLPRQMRYVTIFLMVCAFVLMTASVLPGRIRALVGQPLRLAVAIWAAAHLIANGTIADLLLFGSVLAWMVITLLLKGRVARSPAPAATEMVGDATAIAGGLLLSFLIMRWLHVLVIGVSPMP